MPPDRPHAIPRRLHLIGAGGAGMSGLARYLAGMACEVSGSDVRRSAETDLLVALGVRVFEGHGPDNLGDAALVVVSDAIAADNSELEAARQRGVTVMRRAECLGRLGGTGKRVFVAGSHGKSTTAAMIAKVLEAASASPDFVIGADVASLGGVRARVGAGAFFVAEACEAFGNLAFFHADVAVITNIDDEHVEHYDSADALDEAFLQFALRAGPDGVVIANGDDAGVRRILDRCQRGVTTFGFDPGNDVAVTDLAIDGSGVRFGARLPGGEVIAIVMPVPGRHAVANALACIAACHALGFSAVHIADGLADFTGVSRRWEDHGVVAGICIIDDYAHHPAELKAAIDTARAVAGERRLVVAFQPQLYSRTRRLYRAFAEVLTKCDHVLLLEVDPGGERGSGTVRSALIADEMTKAGGSVQLFVDIEDFIDDAPRLLTAGDFLLIAGAGSIRQAAPRLARGLAAGAQSLATQAPLVRPAGVQRAGAALRAWFRPVRRQPATVLAMFLSQVAMRPDSPALVHGGARISYAALHRMSDAFGSALVARGVARGAAVGVAMPPSIDLIVVMLALMKAGAVYLPVDPNLPADRVRYMLSAAGSRTLITLPDTDLDRICTEIGRLYPGDLAGTAGPGVPVAPGEDDIAYICFTSGSTGYPKGVATSHRSLHGLIGDIVARFAITPATRMALNTSISFDVSVAEIWMTLAGGGALCISGSGRPLVGDRLADLLERSAITHLAVTPSVLASVPARSYPDLRCIVCAGEACPQALADRWADGRIFFNAYGPTEAAVYATVAQCHPGETVTIGRPLRHINAYILDRELRSVRQGEAGELCLGGVGVAGGYLAGEQEGDVRFLAMRDAERGSDWIYRTGDVVTANPDGTLTFLGRFDNQIKIRGNRIELEEVEQSIRRLAGVLDVAVCIDTETDRQELIAFLVMDGNEAHGRDVMRERLSAWLPESMIPAQILEVAAIALTPSGKKDRRTLLAAHRGRIRRRTQYEAPRNETEERLAALWQAVLDTGDAVGMWDDFAALGGDSLKSLLLIAEVEERFGVAVPPGYFGRITTITRMAVQIADLVWDRDRPDSVVAGAGFTASRVYRQMRDLTAGWAGARVRDDGLVISIGREDAPHHLCMCMQAEAEIAALALHLGDSFRVHGMRSGHMVMDYTPENIAQLIGRYIDEITEIRPAGQLFLGGLCQGGVLAHAMAERLRCAGREVPLLVLIEQARLLPFDGRVAFLFAEESFLNPSRRADFGIEPFDAVYGERYSIDIVPGEHSRLAYEPSVQLLAMKLQARVAQAMENIVMPSRLSAI